MNMRVRFWAARVALVLMMSLLIPGAGHAVDGGSRPMLATQASVNSVAYTGCGGVVAPVINGAYEQEVVDRVNNIRATYGLPPLKRAAPLDEAARYHAADMAQDDYFDHNSKDCVGGVLVLVCEWSARIATYYPNWWALAETIAAGYATPALVVEAWMSNPIHRANILSTNNWEIGAGYHVGSVAYDSHWVQSFGRRLDVYPLIINRDAALTDSQDVTLYLYGDWQEMRLRNDDGAWTDWLPFRSTQSWTLAPGLGDHTVWAEMRSAGQSATTSDSIYLTVASPVLGDLPDRLTFTYNRWNGRLSPSVYELTPENTGSNEPLAWQLQQEGDWFQALPTRGTTPASFRIEPTTPSARAVGVYSGAVTVTVVDPAGTGGSPQTVSLMLEVVDRPVVSVFMPIVESAFMP